MFPSEQIPSEKYFIGQRIKVYIVNTEQTTKGPQIVISRSHPGFIQRLFELEVPEISSGTVQIKAIAREAGSRSKVAVASSQEGVDPVGSCVGQRGTRVQAIMAEIGDEKIDIILWDEDLTKYITNALSPAKISKIELNEKKKEASVEVSADQLSLAIGKQGQNVRLAAKLTGWKIDIEGREGDKEVKEDKEEKEVEEVKEPKEVKKEDVEKAVEVQEEAKDEDLTEVKKEPEKSTATFESKKSDEKKK